MASVSLSVGEARLRAYNGLRFTATGLISILEDRAPSHSVVDVLSGIDDIAFPYG